MLYPFRETKDAIEAASQLTPSMLHLLVGLLVFALAAAARGNWRATTPLAVVALIAFGGEFWDLCEDLQRLGYWRWADSLGDIAYTVTLPLLAHGAGRLLRRRRSAVERVESH